MLLEPIPPSACDGGSAGMGRSGRRRRGDELPLEESWLHSENPSVLVEDPVDSGSNASVERSRQGSGEKLIQ
jgi:hypothetical protein